MASINNWLAFSLSPHELPSSQPISGDLSSSDYFSLSPASDPPLAVPTLPFGIMEAFNRTNHHNQDWNIEEPKLEDFLGGHSSSGDYVLSDYANTSSSSSSIGISMIKCWLRNQPAPSSQAAENKSGDAVAARKHGVQSSSQSLSLSMSMGSQSTTSSALPLVVSGRGHETLSSPEKGCSGVPRKSIDTFGQRTSIYRGVTRHRWTGRYEAHLWDNSCRREGQSRKGRQVYLGGYDKEDKAARAYDLAALKYWGPTTTTNFSVSNYEKELEEMKHMTRQEYVASLRRNSSGFSRGASIYRGVTRHHQHGRWQARIGRVAGNKDLYLGTFGTQEEAAEAYDVAAIKFRGLNAVTNFDMNRYNVKSILESTALPIGGVSKRLKDAADRTVASIQSTHFSDSLSAAVTGGYGWHTIAFQQPQPLSIHDPYPAHNREWYCKQEQVDIHQLSTHDFFQQSAEAINSLLTLQDSNGGGFMLPMNGSSHGGGRYVDEQGNYYGGYLGYQQLPVGMAKVVPAAGHEQSGGVNGWVTEEARAGSVCHGAHLFSVWNDS